MGMNETELQDLQELELSEDTLEGRFLTFLLDKEIFGVEIRHVTEIVGVQAITKLPEVPEYIKGIMNLRGQVIPVIDMRIKFRKEPVEYDDRTCVIVININELSVGLIVDNVKEVLSIKEEDIVPPPDFNISVQNQYVFGIGKIGNEINLLLDCEKLLDDSNYTPSDEAG
ncbi:chemotaxis protein CheW [Clostridia bacterium OttesenSCG-928-F22]|nr:chemotaxis protein CheW [Clostridia bacterium OttesenSCG-928-F22]